MINSVELEEMRKDAAGGNSRQELADINHVTIDTGLTAYERMKQYLEQIKNPYRFRCGDTVVRVCFSGAGDDLNSHLINFFSGLKKC